MSVEQRRDIAKTRLEDIIRQGEAQAKLMAAKIHDNVPRDYLVPKNEVRFRIAQDNLEMVSTGDSSYSWDLHKNAIGQLEQRLRIPPRYVTDLMAEGEWGRQLVAHSLSELVRRRGKSRKILVRSVDREARAVLSDRYKRLDSGMILESFVGALQKVGAVPAEAQVFDTKWAVSVLVPQTFEPAPGEVVGFGATLQNSDFGNGALSFSFRILRLICINGMIGRNEMRKVHVGQELSGAMFSERTLRYQTRAVCSALDDVVSHSLSVPRIKGEIQRIRAAMDTEVGNPQQMIKALQKAARITKKEEEELGEVYINGGVEELPVGNNAWRFSQALSCLANTKRKEEKNERALELEILAGEVLDKQVPIAA